MMSEIVVGQRYQKSDAQFIVWQVAKLDTDMENIVHARLVRVGNPSEVKTIAAQTLLDRRWFLRVQGVG